MTATVKHLHIKRRNLGEVIVFAELLLLLLEAKLHTPHLSEHPTSCKNPFLCFVLFFPFGSGFHN